jgi:hypothetical protein
VTATRFVVSVDGARSDDDDAPADARDHAR